MTEDEAKLAAIRCWTNDPIAANTVTGEIGSLEYFDALLKSRTDYAAWMSDILGYSGTSGMRVLDVGCGQGVDINEYALAGAQVTGVDLTPRHCELARAHLGARGLPGEVVQGDAEALPFPDESFDRVSSNGVLHHTPGIEPALREIRRVLRPGGETRIILYNRDSAHYWLTQFLYRGILKVELLKKRSMGAVLSSGVEHTSIGARPLVRVYSQKQLARLLREAGFDEVSTTVRHFSPRDTPITAILSKWIRPLNNPAVLDRIGRKMGWYVIGRGVRR